MESSDPNTLMFAVPPGAPPPLGRGPHFGPQSPTLQSALSALADQRPASVTDCAFAPITQHMHAAKNDDVVRRRTQKLTFDAFQSVA
jgi:hypothetical protein